EIGPSWLCSTLVAPVICSDPDTDDERGPLEPCEIRRPRFESFRVGCRWDDGLDLREVADHSPCEAGKIAGRRDDAHVLRRRGRRYEKRRNDAGERGARSEPVARDVRIAESITCEQRTRSWAAGSARSFRRRPRAAQYDSPWQCWPIRRRRAGSACAAPAVG